MSDLSIEDLEEEAEFIGLSGSDIGHYVVSRENAAREDRTKEREFKLFKMESEKEKKREYEARKEREGSKREKETTEFELAKLKAGTELAQARSASGVASLIFHCTAAIVKPKLPTYMNGEDLTSYFVRFERMDELLDIFG